MKTCVLCGERPALWSFPANELVSVPVDLCPGCTGRQYRGPDGRLTYGVDVAVQLHRRAGSFRPPPAAVRRALRASRRQTH